MYIFGYDRLSPYRIFRNEFSKKTIYRSFSESDDEQWLSSFIELNCFMMPKFSMRHENIQSALFLIFLIDLSNDQHYLKHFWKKKTKKAFLLVIRK